MADKHLWSSIKLEEGMRVEKQIGSLYFRLELLNRELWLGYTHFRHASNGTATTETSTPDEDQLEWSRWSFSEPPPELKLEPQLPESAMVVHSEYPQRILPGDTARIFVSVPAVVRFMTRRSLLELHTEVLSQTWFGNRIEGELCYWWSTRARRLVSDVKNEKHRVGCPVSITNKSDEELYFEKFCHRVTRLPIYRLNDGLWTVETQITYKGGEELSDVAIHERLPEELKEAQRISPPREETRFSLSARTFLHFI